MMLVSNMFQTYNLHHLLWLFDFVMMGVFIAQNHQKLWQALSLPMGLHSMKYQY